jgi:hypothetical protein
MNKKTIIVALLLVFAIGNTVGSSSRLLPIVPDNRPVSRPFAKWIGFLARTGLKLLVFAEPAPEPQLYNRHSPSEDWIDHTRSL